MERELERPTRPENDVPQGYDIPKDLPLLEGKKDEPRVSTGALRCPFCRADVKVEATDWIACRSCLARHHEGCWKESGRCASCGQAEVLAPRGQLPAPVRSLRIALAVVTVLCGALAIAIPMSVRRSQAPVDVKPVVRSDSVTIAVKPAVNVFRVERPIDSAKPPESHLRAFFKKSETRRLTLQLTPRSSNENDYTGTADEFAEKIRAAVQDGATPIVPSPAEAVSLMRKVADLYREDGRLEDAFLMETAVEKLAPKPAAVEKPKPKALTESHGHELYEASPGGGGNNVQFTGTDAEFADVVIRKHEAGYRITFPTRTALRELFLDVIEADKKIGDNANADRLSKFFEAKLPPE